MSLKNVFLLRLFFFAKALFHTMKVNGDQGTGKARFLLNKDFTFSLFLTKLSHRFRRPHSQMDYFHDAFMRVFSPFWSLTAFGLRKFHCREKEMIWRDSANLLLLCSTEESKSYRFRVNIRKESLMLRKRFTDVPPCSAGDLRCDALVCFSLRMVLPSLCCCWNRCPLLCHTAGKTRQLQLQKQRRHGDMELL